MRPGPAPPTPRAAERGLTLIEVLIVVTLLGLVLGTIVEATGHVRRRWESGRRQAEAADDARAALDMIVRLLRMAGNDPRGAAVAAAVDPDPDGNRVFDSVRIQSDWNPADGTLGGRYEDVTFSTRGGRLFTREPGDPAGGVEFVSGVDALRFRYYGRDGRVLQAPQADPAAIAFVEVDVVARPAQPHLVEGGAVRLHSGAALRGRE